MAKEIFKNSHALPFRQIKMMPKLNDANTAFKQIIKYLTTQ